MHEGAMQKKRRDPPNFDSDVVVVVAFPVQCDRKSKKTETGFSGRPESNGHLQLAPDQAAFETFFSIASFS